MELDELEACPVCHEDAAYVETEGGWCVYVECGCCGSHTAYQRYDNEEELHEGERKSIQLWNMGKVVAAGRLE